MSGVGFWELILVFMIGLIVLGPERLPRVAHQLGSWIGQARRMTRMMRRQLEEELNLEKEFDFRQQAPPLPRATRTIQRPAAEQKQSPAPEAPPESTSGEAGEPTAAAAPDEEARKGIS
jgi:sec-independent protein translocase protein TatB